MPSAMVVPADRRGAAVLDRVDHRRAPLALHADELTSGRSGSGRHGHAGQQAAAAGRDDEGVELGVVLAAAPGRPCPGRR